MYLILLPILFPILAGFCLLVYRKEPERKLLTAVTGICLVITSALVVSVLILAKQSLTLFYLTRTMPIYFRIDEVSVFFSLLTVIVFFCAGLFAFVYMKHEQKEKRYYGFYLMLFGVLNALCFAGNLITFYLFFELLTLSSLPLVLHTGTKEAIMAGLKYLFYSLCGAYASLFGIYFLYHNCETLTFTAGGVLQVSPASQEGRFLLLIAFVMILGFGVKAGMFPMHAWLPTAHPAAPAPASAALSAVIVKAGVLALIRVIYYIFGADFLRGSWVQTAWLTLALITVFMGSMLAYREPVLKKRLAYSTVSQLSYILFGLAVMHPDAFTGGLLHVLAHGLIKGSLFLIAGAIIYTTGKTKVDELRGIGKEMPLTMWCYTIVSLGLIGIPPTGGFVSKWYLAIGGLAGDIGIFRYIGPIVLLISALLTAGYLLPLTIRGFFPGADFDYKTLQKREPARLMTIPILFMTILSVIIGLFPNIITDYLTKFVSTLL